MTWALPKSGGFGISTLDDLLLVDDITLIKQRCNPVTVEFDDQADHFAIPSSGICWAFATRSQKDEAAFAPLRRYPIVRSMNVSRQRSSRR